ncbi:hypothetical protein H5407_08875 [Mitsuaria sp. WAJ17]|uniref:hypothetical protein n=1 Tax=Mitsuaria sp. WAJ17 TaxID=2761452 RepID=UPI001602B401|nr:hypothetical protein [Mitsuaria sp. WAJ17]MBB2485338.1 hypothetical protein [Mitsuaria sp. WAJ17]
MAELLDPRIDQFGKRSRRLPGPAPAAVFLPLEALRAPLMAPDAPAEALRWRTGGLAALQAFQRHGYRVLIHAMPADAVAQASRSARLHLEELRQRLAQEAQFEIQAEGLLAAVEADALPDLLRQAAAAQGLDLQRAWYFSWDESLGTASRRVGCRSVRLLEPGRTTRRRWPLLRGHVPMKLLDAVAYVLRCDGHLAAGQPLPAQA